jgi:uncharacterized protein involved in exopolysaccharide biosynthesis
MKEKDSETFIILLIIGVLLGTLLGIFLTFLL